MRGIKDNPPGASRGTATAIDERNVCQSVYDDSTHRQPSQPEKPPFGVSIAVQDAPNRKQRRRRLATQTRPWFINGRISQENRKVEHPERETAWAIVTVNPGGLGVKKQDKVTVRQPSGGDRGEISGLSDESRHRLMQYLMRIDLRKVSAAVKNPKTARAFFVTLTYPSQYPDCDEAKRQLNTFRMRLDYHYPFVWALWIQEFQQRGAPHFHLVVVLKQSASVAAFRRWLADAWYSVVDSGDVKHLAAGTSAVAVYVEPDGMGNLMGYLSGYLGGHGKHEQGKAPLDESGAPIATGRMWGFWRRDNIEFERLHVLVIETAEAWDTFKRRVAYHYRKSPYLSQIDEHVTWGGGLLFGDGLELMKELTAGIEGIAIREANS